ncbi:prolactin precursor [Callorhinchus milii]|uniref:Prolactin n=1 Tax=Callorhinchus milii TaxID=7868 RepID=C6G3Y0_CALMI|nr:prolactin precursor [Callorhinchus milii]ACQ73167.1 prolactin 2 [Callorhinchus milii]|eukprot:gi/632947011/ref/XP_007888844.1/ PREDICTED: prolactin [Callorhinchus milii]
MSKCCTLILFLISLGGRLDTMNSLQTSSLVTVPDLFDRVIQHSRRMHALSSELFTEFEKYLLPSINHLDRSPHRCHTARILTPNGKENAQRTPREELTEVILRLLFAWREPLMHFHQNLHHSKDYSSASHRKAKQMSEMVHELNHGVEILTEKIQLLGEVSNSLRGLWVRDHQGSRAMSDYQLLHCFRRDSNKVQNYLKILKCRVLPEPSC